MKDNSASILLVDDGSLIMKRYFDILKRNSFPVVKDISPWAYFSRHNGETRTALILSRRGSNLRMPHNSLEYPPVIFILNAEDDETCAENVVGYLDDSSSEPVILSAVKRGMTITLSENTVHRNLLFQDLTYKTLIDGMNDSVWVIGLDGTILDVNEKAIEKLGYNRDELIKKGLGGIDHNLSPEEVHELIAKMPTDHTQIFETMHTAKDGRDLTVEISSSIIMYHGEKAILSIARDIHERKEREQKLRAQLEKDQILIKAMHHRIKNNLATVSNLLSLQAKMSDNKEAREVLLEAVGRLQSVSLLYNKLLETGNMKEISLLEYISNLVFSLLEIYPEKKHLAIKWDIDDILLSEKYLFPLGVIMEELVTNIFKYSFPQDREGCIEVIGRQRERHITLSLLNNGMPFPQDFDLGQSKGFGLIIVKLLCKQIRGEYRIYQDGVTKQEISFLVD